MTNNPYATTFTHPEFAPIDVEWLMAWCAGHYRNRAPQIEGVDRGQS